MKLCYLKPLPEKQLDCYKGVLRALSNISKISPLQSSVAYLYPLKTSEKPKGFLMFSGGIYKQHLPLMGLAFC